MNVNILEHYFILSFCSLCFIQIWIYCLSDSSILNFKHQTIYVICCIWSLCFHTWFKFNKLLKYSYYVLWWYYITSLGFEYYRCFSSNDLHFLKYLLGFENKGLYFHDSFPILSTLNLLTLFGSQTCYCSIWFSSLVQTLGVVAVGLNWFWLNLLDLIYRGIRGIWLLFDLYFHIWCNFIVSLFSFHAWWDFVGLLKGPGLYYCRCLTMY